MHCDGELIQDGPKETPPTNQQPQEQVTTNDTSTGSASDPDLNTGEGLSAGVLGRLVQTHMRNGGIERHQERLREGTSARATLEEAKRVTSGIMVGNGYHSLNNPDLLTKINQQEEVTLNKQIDDARKKRGGLLG